MYRYRKPTVHEHEGRGLVCPVDQVQVLIIVMTISIIMMIISCVVLCAHCKYD